MGHQQEQLDNSALRVALRLSACPPPRSRTARGDHRSEFRISIPSASPLLVRRRACGLTANNAPSLPEERPRDQVVRDFQQPSAALQETRHKRPRSPATTTASSPMPTVSRRRTPRTLPSSHQRSAGSRGAPGARPVRSPPTANAPARDRTGSGGPGGTHRRHPAQSQALHRRSTSSTPAGGFRTWSTGEPAARAGSATSSAGTPGTAPGWTAATELRSGAGTGYSPTTWSRSAPLPADRPGRTQNAAQYRRREISLRTFSGGSN